MKCPKCGANLPVGATSCWNCGVNFSVENRCPHCQSVVPLNAVVCPVCEELIRIQSAPQAPREKPAVLREDEIIFPAPAKPKITFHWIFLVAAVTIFSLGFMIGSITTSRASPEPAPVEAPVSSQLERPTRLDGLWRQVNSTSATTYQAAGISDGRIEVMWIDTEADTQSLYWAGTVDSPEELGSEYSWESINDSSKTAGAVMASSDEKKTFTYSDGQLKFSSAVMGTTTLVKMEKVSDTPPDMSGPSVESSAPPPESTESGADSSQEISPSINPETDLYKITYQTHHIFQDSSGQTSCNIMIEIENTSEYNLFLGSPIYDFENADGKLIGTCSSFAFGSSDPDMIAPGEKGYYYSNGAIVDGELSPGMDYVFVPHLDVQKSRYDVVRYDVTDLSISEGNLGPCTILGRVTNHTDEDDSLVWICFILYNSKSEPIGVYGTTITDLNAGQTTSFSAEALPLAGSISYSDISEYKVFAAKTQLQF